MVRVRRDIGFAGGASREQTRGLVAHRTLR